MGLIERLGVLGNVAREGKYRLLVEFYGRRPGMAEVLVGFDNFHD